MHKADLELEPWSGEPIELLVNDAVKTWGIGLNVFRSFMPSVMAPGGVVVHQAPT